MSQLPYLNLIPDNREAFASRLQDIAHRLGVNPAWLMIIFYIETAAAKYKKIDHRVSNSLGAIGLIQFMPSTQAKLGVTAIALKAMSNVQQLDYVLKYLSPFSGRMKNLTDIYLAVFFPAAIGKPENWTLQSQSLTAGEVAKCNPLYDLDKNMQITVGEIRTKLQTFIPSGYVL